MARIDVQTLVMAFEARLNALEKNPPDKVPTAVILKLLEKGIEEEIKNHFVELIRRDMVKRIKDQFAEMRDEFIKQIMERCFTNKRFMDEVEQIMKEKMLNGLKGY